MRRIMLFIRNRILIIRNIVSHIGIRIIRNRVFHKMKMRIIRNIEFGGSILESPAQLGELPMLTLRHGMGWGATLNSKPYTRNP